VITRPEPLKEGARDLIAASRLRGLREIARDALVACAIVLTMPLWLLAYCESRLTHGERMFAGCSELLSLFPGPLGIFLRRGFYALTLESCAWDCHLGFGTTLAHRNVRIAPRVYVGNRCTVGCACLEEDVTIGSNVDLLSGRRQHAFDELGVPIQAQSKTFRQIRIGRNTWIGNSAVVMADVGEDCVIGAGSVVVQALPPRVVAVGNPARMVRERVRQQEPHSQCN
jgi:virginiamycin A acetyltransferase